MEKGIVYAEFAIGLIIIGGMILSIVVILAVRFAKRNKNPHPQFDERQIIARGQACKAGFITLLIYNALYASVYLMGFRFINTAFAFIIGIVISSTVFDVVAINKDAYFAINNNNKKLIKSLIISDVLSFLTGIMLLINLLLITSQINSYYSEFDSFYVLMSYFTSTLLKYSAALDFLVVAMITVVLIAMLIHKKIADESGAEDEQ